MNICLSGQTDISGIYHDQPGTPFHCLTDLHTDDRMCFLRVGTYQHDHIHIIRNITDGIGHGSASQCHGKSGYGCGMTDSGTVIYIIGTKRTADHLLQHIAVLVRRTGAGETCQCIGTILVLDLCKFRCNEIQCLIPGSTLKLSGLMVLDQRIF